MISAGRYGQIEVTIDGIEQTMTVVALEDESDGRIKVRCASNDAECGVCLVPVERIDWSGLTGAARKQRGWWRTPLESPTAFLPLDVVFGVATMAERNNIALDVAYISDTGHPVDVVEATVLDMGYAAGAILAQAADQAHPIQVMRRLDAMLEFSPALAGAAYDEAQAMQRVLISIPLHQVLSIRLRTPTLTELTTCSCAYLLDAPQGYRRCAACKQQEAAANLVAAHA